MGFKHLTSISLPIRLWKVRRSHAAYRQRQAFADSLGDNLGLLRLATIIGESIPSDLCYRLSEANLNGELTDESSMSLVQIAIEHHRHHLLKRTPRRCRSLLRRVPCGHFPILELNAIAVTDEERGSFAIGLSSWLIGYLMYANWVWLLLFTTEGNTDIRERLRNFKRYIPGLVAFLLETPDKRVLELPPSSENGLNSLKRMAGTYFQTRFVLAHEYAHIILGHLEQQNTHVLKLQNEESIRYIRRNWDQELEADLLGAKLLIQSFKKLKPIGLESVDRMVELAVFSAPTMVLCFQHFLKKVVPSFAESSTHPPSEMRIRTLHESLIPEMPEHCREWCETLFDTASALGSAMHIEYPEDSQS